MNTKKTTGEILFVTSLLLAALLVWALFRTPAPSLKAVQLNYQEF